MSRFVKVPILLSKSLTLFLFFNSFQSLSTADSGEAYFLKRIHAHLLLQDSAAACQEACLSLQLSPHSKALNEAYIKALAQAGDETRMIAAWKNYARLFPEEARDNHDLQECMAWGIIANGAKSSTPIIRLIAMLGAFFGQDAKGVEILQNSLHDQNTFVRGAAAQLSGHLRDASLQDEILRLLKSEKSWKARLEVIKAAGSMKIEAAKPELVSIIAEDSPSAEEKAAAIQSLVTLLDTADRRQIEALASSNRAGLRELACQVVSHLGLANEAGLIAPLVDDNRAEVRAAALQTLGILRTLQVNGQSTAHLAERRLSDPDHAVAISAAWLLTLCDPEKGQRAFSPWLKHESREVRLLGAAALAASGKYGLSAMRQIFNESQDPFVRMNLALGLISQQSDVKTASDALYSGIVNEKTRWMWNEETMFRTLAPSKVRHEEETPNYPEAVNQLVRLEILNLLAIMKHPQAQKAVKGFLQERNAGITGLASALLLTEGDSSALDLVQNLLGDPDQKVRIQAAVILALWGRGEDALSVLEQSYEKADRQTKERILEGIGKVGSRKSIPFLVERLGEPMQTLRIIAASALLQCLYH